MTTMATESVAVKERPIIFSAPMVRAILDGRKTQTRRVLKPGRLWPDHAPVRRAVEIQPGYWQIRTFDEYDFVLGGIVMGLPCPYGKPGDRLWVRESFYIDHVDYLRGPLPKERPAEVDENLYYRADGECCDQIPECSCAEIGKPKWRPARFIPKWAARLRLDITRVRVERVQDITTQDAIAEGIDSDGGDDEHRNRSSVENYALLWDRINGEGSWDSNPWVWVVEFKRLQAPAEHS